MRRKIRLNPDVIYPLYAPRQQARAYESGRVTHKLAKDMNRHERRRAAHVQRRWVVPGRAVKEASDD